MISKAFDCKFTLVIIVFWICMVILLGGYTRPEANLPDTLELDLEQTHYLHRDTLYFNLFTGHCINKTLKLTGVSSDQIEIVVDYTIPQTYVLKFDGPDARIDLGEGILHNYNCWTIEGWVCHAGDDSGLLIYAETVQKLGVQEMIYHMGDDGLTLVFDNYGSIQQEIDAGLDFWDAAWHHVAAVRKGDSINLYVDGALKNSALVHAEIDTGLNARMGIAYPEIHGSASGLMYDLRIWDYALGNNEINKQRYIDLRGNEKGLIGCWKCNTGSGRILYDRSAKQRNGLIKKGLKWTLQKAPYSLEWIKINAHNLYDSTDIEKYITLCIDVSGLHEGAYKASLSIKNRLSDETLWILPFRINVRDAPEIFLFADTVIIDEVVFRKPVSKKILVCNHGSDTLVIHEIASNNKDFIIEQCFNEIPPGGGEYMQLTYSPSLFGSSTAQIRISAQNPYPQEAIMTVIANELSLPGTFLQKWFAIAAILLIAVILVYIFLRIYLKQKASRLLEYRIEQAIQAQEQQQNIILHQSSLTMLGEISAGIAQEIKVTLEQVLEAANTPASDRNLEKYESANVKHIVETVYKGVDKINKLIEHIRVFSSQQKSALIEKYSVNEVILDALSMVNVKMRNLNIEMELLLSQNLPVMTGNPYKLEQVILNVVNNAIDALKKKSEAGEVEQSNMVNIITRLIDNNVSMEIIDNGPGISEIERPHVFKPFYTTKKPGEAAGLGLSLSLSLVNEMHGSIDIESIIGKGTSCEIKIPVNA